MFPRESVRYSVVSCQLSAQLQICQGGWWVRERDVGGLCLFGPFCLVSLLVFKDSEQ